MSTVTPPSRDAMGDFPPEIAARLIAITNAVKVDIEALESRVLSPKGANLGDANATLQIVDGRWRVLPAVPLTANRTLTLGTTGAIVGDQLTVTRLDTAAFTVAFLNGGPGAGTLVTLPASKVAFARFYFDGTNWLLRECGTL